MNQDPKLIIMRHPQSLANIGHRVAGNDDVLSSDYGKKQAIIFADHHAGEFHDFVLYSSTKIRCKDLVQVLDQKNNFSDIVLDHRLDERNFGEFNNIAKDKMIEMLGFFAPHLKPICGNDFSAWMDHSLEDENGVPLYQSNRHLVENLFSLYIVWENILKEGRSILALTHSGVIRGLNSVFLNKSSQEIDKILPNNRIPNCSITEYVFQKDQSLHLTKIAYIDPIVQKKFDSISPRKTG